MLLQNIVSVDPVQLHQKVFIRDQIPNMVIHSYENITLSLMKYFGGPLLNFTIIPEWDNSTSNDNVKSIFHLKPTYEIKMNGETGPKNPVFPVRDTKYLLKTNDKHDYRRTFMIFIDEGFYLRVFDFTDELDPKEVHTTYLIDIIKIYIGDYDENDIFWNSLNMLNKDQLYMLPWNVNEKQSFLIWIVLYRVVDNFKARIIAHRTEHVLTDPVGKNAIAVVYNKGTAVIASSAISKSNELTISVYDVRLIEYDILYFKYSKTYKSLSFNDPKNWTHNISEFNIRDIESYIAPQYNDSTPEYAKFNFIVSCYNNGLLFFKIKNIKNLSSDEQVNADFDLIDITERYFLSDLGRIFTEKEYKLNTTEFNLFVSQASPPVVYEFQINENMNLNVKRIYKIFDVETNRYVGNDMIAANKDYMGILLYDYKLELYVLRIYHRVESMFSSAHIEIGLKQFGSGVSAISFLNYEASNTLFVRNFHEWFTYDVLKHEIDIDTITNLEPFEKSINQTWTITITAISEFCDSSIPIHFNITLVEDKNTNPIFVGTNRTIQIQHVYGNTAFRESVSDQYSGPNLNFTFDIINQKEEIIEPVIFPTFNSSLFKRLNSSENWTLNMFTRYNDQYIQNSNIAFYWILSNKIVLHNFVRSSMYDQSIETFSFPKDSFIDFYRGTESVFPNGKDKTLIVLSRQNTKHGIRYVNHVFSVYEDLLMWITKDVLENDSLELRADNPMVDLDGGRFLVFIDSTEHTIIFSSYLSELNVVPETNSRRIYDAHIWWDDRLYLSHYNSQHISSYRIVNYTENGKQKLDLESKPDIIFGKKYTIFDIGKNGTATIFYDQNLIDVFKSKDYSKLDYIRRLPMFKFRETMKFSTNDDTFAPTYKIKDQFLYVIMVEIENLTKKRLFIYDLHSNSHDSLRTIIDLKGSLSKLNNYITIETSTLRLSIYIFLFYGGKDYHFICFEPDSLMREDPRSNKTIFLSPDISSYEKYNDQNFTIQVYPASNYFNENMNLKNDSCIYELFCTNYGLMIESRIKGRKLFYKDDSSVTYLNLYDFIDGFNNTFELNYYSSEKTNLNYEFAKDKLTDYFIDSVKNIQQVMMSFIYQTEDLKNVFLFILFEEEDKMQMYQIDETITKYEEDLNYTDVFGCKPQYLKYESFNITDNESVSYVAINWYNYTQIIKPTYNFRLMTFTVTCEEGIYRPKAEKIFERIFSRRITSVHIQKSILESVDYHMLVLSNYYVTSDSLLYVYDLKGASFETWEVSVLTQLSTIELSLDQFVVKSVMFIVNEPYFMASVDNYGILVFDLVTKTIIDHICFNWLLEDFPDKFKILSLAPVDDNGAKVIFEKIGSFSFIWESIDRYGNRETIFNNSKISTRFINIGEEISTDLIWSTYLGYVQLIYHQENDGVFEAYLRLYNYYNHYHSKQSREVKIGTVEECISVNEVFTNPKVIIIWGSKIFMYTYVVNPSLYINPHHKTEIMHLDLIAKNKYSNQYINITIENQYVESGISSFFVFMIFFSIVIVFYIIMYSIARYTLTQKVKSKDSNEDRTSNKFSNIGLSKFIFKILSI